jgi:hypothetical protein
MGRIEQGYIPDYHGFRALLDRYGIVVSNWDEHIVMYDRARNKAGGTNTGSMIAVS